MSASFDPAAPASADSGLFGLSSSPDAAGVHILPLPFDATTSYRKGAALAPAAILRASHQVDLYDLLTGRPYEAGIWMAPIEPRTLERNLEATRAAEAGDTKLVDGIQRALDLELAELVTRALDRHKLVGVLGGDHSVPLAAIRTHAERFPGMGLLHFDAHADLRPAYEGFTFSHASILHNVLASTAELGNVVQVGVRDLSEEEHDAIRASDGRVQTLFGHEWARARASGADLVGLIRHSLAPLPTDVYVTFDVDGLDPAFCPNTGTPVPGGLSFDEAMLWLEELVRSGRRIVGFDLCEVAPGAPLQGPPGTPDGWDEIVGARLLYRLIGFALASRGKDPA